PLVSGSGWLPPSAAVLTAMALVGAGLRFLPRGAALLVPPAQLLVALAVVTAVFAPQAAVAGFVPTPASLDELGRILLQGRQEIDANPPPVAGTAGVALVFALGAAAAGAVGDVLSVTARTPALTGVPLFAMLLFPLAVDDQGVGPARSPWPPAATWPCSRWTAGCAARAGRRTPARRPPAPSARCATGCSPPGSPPPRSPWPCWCRWPCPTWRPARSTRWPGRRGRTRR